MSQLTQAKSAWIERVLGVAVPTGTQKSGPTTAAGKSGQSQWRFARAAAVGKLVALEAGIRKLDHPKRDRAVIILRAIRANLTEQPDTVQQVDSLARYLASDNIIAAAETPNGLGVTLQLRTPLLTALEALRQQLTITAGGQL